MRNLLLHRSESLMSIDLDRLVACGTIEQVAIVLCEIARATTGADGITVIRREGDEVLYLTEDAIAPLWTGQHFPIRSCVSGMAILANQPILIPDIAQDRRVPMNAYLSTFVHSMAMVPIGSDAPRFAMGAYWRQAGPIPALALEQLTALAALAADAIERIEGGSTPYRAVA